MENVYSLCCFTTLLEYLTLATMTMTWTMTTTTTTTTIILILKVYAQKKTYLR